MKTPVPLLLSLLWLGSAAYGQAITGSIVGVLTDSSGLAVAGAEITLTSVSTGALRKAQIDGPKLRIATAWLLAALPGYRRGHGRFFFNAVGPGAIWFQSNVWVLSNAVGGPVGRCHKRSAPRLTYGCAAGFRATSQGAGSITRQIAIEIGPWYWPVLACPHLPVTVPSRASS